MSMAHRTKDGSKRVLVYVYYSGHGVMDTTTKIVLNEEDEVFRYFSMEAKLSIAAKYQNTYVVAVFDCCRERLPTEGQRGGEDGPVKIK